MHVPGVRRTVRHAQQLRGRMARERSTTETNETMTETEARPLPYQSVSGSCEVSLGSVEPPFLSVKKPCGPLHLLSVF